MILDFLSRLSELSLNFLSAVLVHTFELLLRDGDGILEVLILLLCSKALFLKLHIDSRHFAEVLLLSLVLEATFIFQQLGLPACWAILSNDDLPLVLRLNFKVALSPQISHSGAGREQLDT